MRKTLSLVLGATLGMVGWNMPVHAQTSDDGVTAAKPTPAGLPVLQIGPLINRGGAAILDPDGTPLYTGFARALAFALKGEGQITPLPFAVETRDTNPDPKLEPERAAPPIAPKPVPKPMPLAAIARFRLEGEISVTGTEGPYLCVLRLVDTAGKGRVAAQWAGVAQTLRDLTGNLQRDSRVHPLGLAGEFAHRVTGTTRGLLTPSAGTINEEFAKRVAGTEKTKRLTMEAVPEGGKAGAAFGPGAKYRLRVATQDAGDVYVFTLDKQNQPVAAFSQADPPVALPGRPVLLPARGAPFSLTTSGVPTFIAVLVRRSDVSVPLLVGANAVSTSALGTISAPFDNPNDASLRKDDSKPAVVMLDGSGRLPDAPADPLVARLMALLKTKTPDEILSTRLTVKADK